MSWVKLDDQFPTHPKIVAAGGDAAWLHVCALCYCATYLTDGMLPKAMVERISDRKQPRKLAAVLVEVGSWIDRGDDFELHGYLDYNPSREQVETERRKAAERRAKGGRTSGERRATNMNPVPSRPDVPSEQPPNPRRAGARTNGTNPRAANVDAFLGVTTKPEWSCDLDDECVNGYIDVPGRKAKRCACNPDVRIA